LADLPDTHESLLLKLQDPADAESWERFVVLYRPVVLRFARRYGLQHADAEDLAQRVIIAVAGAISDWRKDGRRGTFRGWLLRIAKNQIINVLTREVRYCGRGGTTAIKQLQQHSAGTRYRNAFENMDHYHFQRSCASDTKSRPV
jgi:RNA polymerase sigma-70 factor (ECF subfamily)